MLDLDGGAVSFSLLSSNLKTGRPTMGSAPDISIVVNDPFFPHIDEVTGGGEHQKDRKNKWKLQDARIHMSQPNSVMLIPLFILQELVKSLLFVLIRMFYGL